MDSVLSRQDLARRGFNADDVTRALRCCLIRIRRDTYVVKPGCTEEAHTTLLNATAQASQSDVASAINARGLRAHASRLRVLARSHAYSLPEDAAISHVSAALLWGFPLTRPIPATAEAVRPARSRSRRHLIVRRRQLSPGETAVLEGMRVTSPLRTLVDVAADYPLDVSVPMIDHALRTGAAATDQLDAAVASATRRSGIAHIRSAFALANVQHESPAESICTVRFHEHGIEGFVPQISLGTHEDGFISRVDFLHREAMVIVEVNGESKYVDGPAGEARFKREREQEIRLRRLGYRFFQLSWKDLFTPSIFFDVKRSLQ